MAQHDEAKDTSPGAMVRKARSIGLNVAAVCPTLGDGNCLYRAIVEALSISRSPYWGNHCDLRNEIVSYVDHNRHLDFVTAFANTLSIVDVGEDIVSLDTIIRRQYRNGAYGSELFILAAAQKLGIVILVTKYDCTFDFQYEIFWPYDMGSGRSNDEILANYDGTVIIISHKYNHFQSLYFLNDATLHQVRSSSGVNLSASSKKKIDRQSSPVNFVLPDDHNYAISSENLKGKGKASHNVNNKRKYGLLEEHNYARPDNDSRKKARLITRTEKEKQEELNDILRSIFKDKSYVDRKISDRQSELVDFVVEPLESLNSGNSNLEHEIQEAALDETEHSHNPRETPLHSNPDVEKAMEEFNNAEKLHSVQQCLSCYETRPIFYLVSEKEQRFVNGRCKRCSEEIKINKYKKHNNRSLMFSGIFSPIEDCFTENGISYHNNQHFMKIPPFLKKLTFIETLLIRKISIAIYVHSLKYGMLASKGHAVAIPHDLRKFTQLPQLPSEVGIILIRSGKSNSKAYFACRERVQEALDGLIFGVPKYGESTQKPGYTCYTGKDHVSGVALHGKYFLYQPNPYYWDVMINFDRLKHLPEKEALLEGLPVISTDESNLNEAEEDLGPGPKQFDNLQPEEELVTTSGFAAQPANIDLDDKIKAALKLFLGEDKDKLEDILKNGGVADLGNLKSEKKEKPIPELSTEGFFTMAYPNIFINGSCDITIPSTRTADYDKWVDHIYFCADNRVSSHRFLKFHLLNIGLRKKALNQGSFCVNQQVNEKQLTRDELTERLQNKDDSMPKKFLSMCSNIINTDPFWKERKYELDSLCFFKLHKNKVYPGYFDTSSCAEHHWVHLHDILIEYLSKTTGSNIKDLNEKFQSDAQFRHQVILENQHIITSYFNARHLNYKDTVLKSLFQYEDDWSRYEFAKSRGAIHSHALYFSKDHYDIVKAILDQDPSDPTVDIAGDLEKWLQSTELNTEKTHSPQFVSMHPAGGAYAVNDETGERYWVPNKNLWPKPDGTLEETNPNVLKDCLLCKTSTESLTRFQVDVVNKVMLHKCSKYCLRRKTVSTKERDESGRRKKKVVRYCRHHFGEYNEATKRSSGKETNTLKPRLVNESFPRYEGRNDHPRMVQHVSLRPLSWLGQCDTQAITSKDLLALIKYITGYCCKGATTTSELVQIYQDILDKSEPNITLKSVAQKLILKTVGIVDTPSSCADYINVQGKLYQCSRKFNRCGLSGFRLFDAKGNKDGEVTKKTTLDKFLGEPRRLLHPNISLYDFLTICTCPKSKPCRKDHVPVFTGCQRFWNWPVSEKFAKELLMIFSPGTWRDVEDLKGSFETFTESFASFLDSDLCPEAVTMMLQFAKVDFDKKMLRKNRKRNEDREFESDSFPFSQSTENSQSSQGSNPTDTLGNDLLRDIARNHRVQMSNAEVDEPVLYAGTDGFDWHKHGKDCLNIDSISEEQYQEMKSWLSNVSDDASREFDRTSRLCTLPEVDPKLVNKLQMVIVYYNLKALLQFAKRNIDIGYHHCKRLIVQGCAGTGKSQVIKIITRMVRRMFKSNRSVLNVAPTGAAAVLLPDGGTIHSAVHIPRNTGSNTATLVDKPMSADKYKELKKLTLDENEQLSLMCINADERGMVGEYALAWFHHRFNELSIRLLETEGGLPFGCIPAFNFFGDLFQLGAIGSSNLGDPIIDSTTPIEAAGNLVYRNFEDVIVLEEIMRQKPDQMALLKRLDNLRTGNVTRKDWEEINARSLNSLCEEEKKSFDSEISNVICLTETWKEAKIYNKTALNSKYVNGNRAVSAEIISTGVGKHHSKEKESMGQIPNVSIVAAGCRVILTKNQGSLTRLGLNNGALGTVVSIVYKEGVKPPAFPEVIVVDFPKYKGPQWHPDHPTWVPIPLNKVFCDAKCCHREGFPLITGYALTITKSQGMTIGRNQQITNVIIKLSPEIGMEAKNYGTAYTAFSRVTEDADWCIAEPVPFERLEYLNRHPKKKVRQAEEKRLKLLSEKTIQENPCSIDQYLDLIREIDVFCNDDIQDSLCTNPSDKCRCVLHSLN